MGRRMKEGRMKARGVGGKERGERKKIGDGRRKVESDRREGGGVR